MRVFDVEYQPGASGAGSLQLDDGLLGKGGFGNPKFTRPGAIARASRNRRRWNYPSSGPDPAIQHLHSLQQRSADSGNIPANGQFLMNRCHCTHLWLLPDWSGVFRSCMGGLVDAELAAAGEGNIRNLSPTLVLNRATVNIVAVPSPEQIPGYRHRSGRVPAGRSDQMGARPVPPAANRK